MSITYPYANTNTIPAVLIRQYFPKSTDFDKVSSREIKQAQRELNNHPRAVLDYKKPDEIINQFCGGKGLEARKKQF